REPVRPFDLPQECLAVLRVTHRARRDRERALRAEGLELASILRQRVPDARDRNGKEAAAFVDAFAEPRDARAAQHLVDAAVLDVGDEQARGVRPEVDRPDARHLRGSSVRNESSEPRASVVAERTTASCASDSCSRSMAAVSRSLASLSETACRSASAAVCITASRREVTAPETALNARQARSPRTRATLTDPASAITR